MPDSASHRSGRVGWLRAAVLGANDGIISVASLVVGVAASGAPRHSVLLTGIAGLVAGTVAMAPASMCRGNHRPTRRTRTFNSRCGHSSSSQTASWPN